MSAATGMTLSESGALARLENLAQAIFLTDRDITTTEAREVGRQLRAVRLFVKAEARAHAKAALDEVVKAFADGKWSADIDKVVEVINRRFGWGS